MRKGAWRERRWKRPTEAKRHAGLDFILKATGSHKGLWFNLHFKMPLPLASPRWSPQSSYIVGGKRQINLLSKIKYSIEAPEECLLWVTSFKKKKKRFIYLFVCLFYFWLCWVFVAAQAFSGCGEWWSLSGCGVQASPCGCPLAAEHGV